MLGAAFGALASLYINDRLGRLRAWRLAALVWAAGLFIQIFSSGIFGLLLFARIFSGLGAGALTVAAPLYLSEIAPAKIRGMITSCFMVFLLFFLSLGKCLIFCSGSYFYRSVRSPFRLEHGNLQTLPHSS